MTQPTFILEQKLWDQKHYVIGIDEVGRGALAGPVTVGAVCFRPSWVDTNWEIIQQSSINDSKILSAKKREVLTHFIKEHALAYATHSSSVSEINSRGIMNVLDIIFNDVVQKILAILPPQSTISVLVDGIVAPTIENISSSHIQTIIDGDAKSLTIAAASILAKVDRDQQMVDLSSHHPEYGWEKNKGYGTQVHIAALRTHGATHLHRNLFVDSIISSSSTIRK